MGEMGTLLRAFVRLHRRGAAVASESQWCMEEAVGSVLRLSRAAPHGDHAATRGDVKELWIQSDLQMLYGDALAFFARPPRQLPAPGEAEQQESPGKETNGGSAAATREGVTIAEAKRSGNTAVIAKAVASAVREVRGGTAADIPGGGVSEAWLEVTHVLCEGVRRVTAATALQLPAAARPALLCKVDHEDAVRVVLCVLHVRACSKQCCWFDCRLSCWLKLHGKPRSHWAWVRLVALMRRQPLVGSA